MSVQEAAVSLQQKVLFYVGIDWAAETHAVCVMDANGRIRAQFMIGHTATGFAELLRRPARLSGAVVVGLDPAVAHPDLEAGGQDVGQHDCGLVGHTVGQLVQGVLGEGPRTSSARVPMMRWPRIQPMPEAPSLSRQCTGSCRWQ